jgi:hypothetical protein
MSLWIATGGEFLKGKLAHKNKNKEAPAKLVTQIRYVLQHRPSTPVSERPVQFCPFDKQKFHKFVDQGGTKGYSRQDIRIGETPFGCGFINFQNILSIVEGSLVDNPFYKFMAAFEKFRLPAFLECPVWIWITDSRRKAQV